MIFLFRQGDADLDDVIHYLWHCQLGEGTETLVSKGAAAEISRNRESAAADVVRSAQSRCPSSRGGSFRPGALRSRFATPPNTRSLRLETGCLKEFHRRGQVATLLCDGSSFG